jgi:ribosomal protein L12E/L44/L45/RPP1/RPP2
MKHLCAYFLLRLGGHESPNEDDIRRLLATVGISADENQLARLYAALDRNPHAVEHALPHALAGFRHSFYRVQVRN